MEGDDFEDDGFEYEDDEEEEQNVDIENKYYNSKGLVETDPVGALTGFAEVLQMETEKTKWGFRALKHTVKLHCQLGRYNEMMEAYNMMLTYVRSAVTRTYSGKCVSNLMNFVSGSASQDFNLLQVFYEVTLKFLEEVKNESLWFKINLKFCNILFHVRKYGQMKKILKELHKSSRTVDESDDQIKGTELLEMYAIEIQMYMETKNNKKLKSLYQKALAIKSAVSHPLIIGIIRECGGKMYLAEKNQEKAASDFFEAFKNFAEAGSECHIRCLKYLVLTYMLMGSEVNPFDAQEARPYKNHPEILAMTNLVAAYQRGDIMECQEILKSNGREIVEDSFFRNYIEDVLKRVRTVALKRIVMPYAKIRIPFIAKRLNMPADHVQQFLVDLVMNSVIDGRIDQVNGIFENGDRSIRMTRYTAICKWNAKLDTICHRIANKVC